MKFNLLRTTRPVSKGWLVIVLGSLSALAPLSIDMYLPSLPKMAVDLHVNASLTQLSLTFCLLGLALGQLLAGPISDARGRRTPLLIGLTIYTGASLLCFTTSSIWFLIILRFIQGLAGSAGIVIARAMARDLYAGSNLTKFFALLMLVNGAAPILAPIAGGQLLRITTWHGVFLVLGGLGMAMLAAVLFGLPETLPRGRRTEGGLKNTLATLSKLVRNKHFMGYVASQGLVMAAMFGYIAGSPFVLQNLFHTSPQTFSLIFATNGLGIIIASQTSARLAGYLGESKVLVAGLVIAALGSLLLGGAVLFSLGLVAILISLFFVVASVGIVGTTTASLALQDQGQNAGSAAALLGVSGMLAGALATPLVGVLGSQTDIPMTLVILVCDLGATGCYILLVARSRRSRADVATTRV